MAHYSGPSSSPSLPFFDLCTRTIVSSTSCDCGIFNECTNLFLSDLLAYLGSGWCFRCFYFCNPFVGSRTGSTSQPYFGTDHMRLLSLNHLGNWYNNLPHKPFSQPLWLTLILFRISMLHQTPLAYNINCNISDKHDREVNLSVTNAAMLVMSLVLVEML